MRSYATFPPPDDAQANKRSPLTSAGPLSRLLLAFVSPLMRTGSARQLETRDFWPLDTDNRTANVFSAFRATLSRCNGSVLRAMLRTFGVAVLVSAVATLLSVACAVLAPLVLHHVVDAMAEPAADMERDLTTWLLVFFAAKLANALVSAQANLYLQIVANRMYNALRAVLFEKALRRSARGKGANSDKKGGESQEAAAVDLANLYSTDVGNLLYTVYQCNNLWILPLQIGIVIYFLYAILGAAAFAGLGVIVLTMVLSFFIALIIGGVFEQIMARKDARMKAIKEVFGAIQIVKLNAWEDKFAERIRELRSKELDSVGRFAYTISATVFLLWASPILVSAISFAVYALVMGQQLTAAKVFTSIALFNAIREPLRQLPTVLQMTIQAVVSLGRINEFLAMEEYDSSNVTHVSNGESSSLLSPGVAVSIQDASFGWSNDSPTLKNVNLEVREGDLVVVHGSVGSGKSTLCMSLLGETHKLSGSVAIRGSVAYYSQQTWIQNLTVRENIVFGLPFDQAKYQQVIEACGLLPDLRQLAAGDSTEIGQKGVNLSGGQKARVCLARACYADADVYILDSPLAAVDAVVQKEIFNKCICGLLATKTIVLVTHNPEVIGSSTANCKVLIANNGEEVSVTREAVVRPRSEYRLSDVTEEVGDSDAKNGEVSDDSGRLIVEEERVAGRVSKSVYWAYFKAVGGVRVCAFLLLVQFLWQGFQISSDLWLSHWTGQRVDADTASDQNVNVKYNITVYSLLGAGTAFMVLVRVVMISFLGLKASRELFEAMTRALLHAPLRFFDTNPIGRIVNRYGDDLTAVDLSVQFAFGSFLAYVFFTTCQLATAVYMVSFLGLLIIPLVYMYATVANYYLASSREVARHFRVSESPLLSHVTQSEEGVVVLRAFGDRAIQNAVAENVALNDTVTRVWVVKAATDQWFALRIELVGCGVVTLIVSSLIYLRAVLSPGLVGLAFTYALSVDGGLAGLVQVWSWLEIEMVSPERLLEYTAIPPEGGLKSGSVVRPPAEWPTQGSIVFSKVAYRYDDAGGPLVLKDVSFSIGSKEKIGIVGRTGAGKSSLTMALFRINELAAGTISIDGIDISTISLHALRSHMTIIPQSPVLFKGTLRNYLDPFEEFSDADIWSSLERVDMKQQVSELDGKLSHELSENGENFSVGERQLLCMARALLTKSRIVVMDEATASIDHATEKKLQEMIGRDLQDATVLTIAHRLSTVLDSDRIMVLSDGRVVEFGVPGELAVREGGVFRELVSEGGYLDQLL